MMTESEGSIEQAEPLSREDIFLKIWVSPRKIFRKLHDSEYDGLVIALIAIYGAFTGLDGAADMNLGGTLSLGAAVVLSILFGAVIALLFNFIYAALVSVTGKWFKGKSDTWSILRVLAHAMVPALVGSLYQIVLIFYFGSDFFRSDWLLHAGDFAAVAVLVGMGIQFFLLIWSLVLFVTGVSEIQNFSIGEAILNILLPLVILVVVSFLLFIIVDVVFFI